MSAPQRLNADHVIARSPAPASLPRESQAQFPVLVAIAGDECTSSTVRMAEALAAQRGATPSLLYVMEVMPVANLDGGIGTAVLTQMLLDPTQYAKDEQSLRATCHVDTGVPASWPFAIDLGNPASSIVIRAQDAHARLIVMGLHHHGSVDHLLGEDTVRNVIATGTTPVLAARRELTGLPRTIVVAMDFSIASLRAARLARQILADDGTLHLVFVEPLEADTVNESEQGRHLIETKGVDIAFQQMRSVLDPTSTMTIRTTKRFGNPIEELKAVCAEVQPDVVAIGSQRHPFLKRLFVGTVTKAMLSDGRWSMLITPPAAR